MSLAELFYARQTHRARTNSRRAPRRPRRSAFVFEALEPRLLLSADPIVAALTATLVDAVDDTSTTAEDTSITIDVLANDIDASSLAIIGFTNGAHGTVTMVASQLVYTPDPNYHGTDTFTYTAEQAAPGTQTAPGGTVLANAITLPSLNFAFDPPALIATDQYDATGLVFGPDAVGVFDDGIAAWTGLSDFFGTGLVADNRSPISGFFVMPNTTTDATTNFLQVEVGLAAANALQLEVFDIDGNLLGSALNGSASTGPHGRALVDITATGIHSFRVSRTALGVTIDEDWAMTQITFGELTALAETTIDTATVTVTVTPVNDTPATVDDAATTSEDTPVTVDVLANDSDVDADTLAISGFTNGAHGTVLLVSGTLVYTPAPNFHGADTFDYTIDDGHGGTDSASVAITVGSVNDTPDAANDAATTNEDTAITIAVLPNDTDLDGDTPTITGVGTAGTLGEVTINGNGTLTYDPNGQFESLGVGQTATDTFTYTIGDGLGGADTATVTVTVTGVADGTTPVIHLETFVKTIVDPGGFEGGTAKFWREHTGKWFGYAPTDRFEDVFGVDIPGNHTLLQALNMVGTGLKGLMREATAALLNAANPNVHGKRTESDVIDIVRDAVARSKYDAATHRLAEQNARPLDLSDGALTSLATFGVDADTAPGPRVSKGASLLFTYVVTNPGTTPLTNVTVIDDNGTPGITSDDFRPHAVLKSGFNVGDTDRDGALDPGEQWMFVMKDRAERGSHVNVATASGQSADGSTASDSDATHYFTRPGSALLRLIEKGRAGHRGRC